jgi:hypothetical protein
MTDEDIVLCNTCTDLVSLRKYEAFPLRLLKNERSGDWVGVREICHRIGVPAGDLKPEVFATWLADPGGQEGYVVILFYDDESQWSMTAHYNRARLLDGATPNQSRQSNGAALSVSASSKPLESIPAVEQR